MEIDKTRYKVWNYRHFSVIHWLVNPGLVINELILGQRIAKVTLIDKTSDRPLIERTIIPCPHCNTYHDGRTWSDQNTTAFKNWFGLYCPHCSQVIPCVRNWTAGLLLIVTYPLWFWWIGRWKASWLNNQPVRFIDLMLEPLPPKPIRWKRMGLIWGAAMYIIMTLTLPIATGTPLTWQLALFSLPLWALGGLAFGLTMKWALARLIKNPDSKP